MRVAVCLSGLSRNYVDTFQYFKKHIIDVFNPDIFIYTCCNDESMNEIVELYKPIYSQNDKVAKQYDLKFDRVGGVPFNAINMFFKIYKCNEMKKQYEKENNFKYDLVMRCRLDAFFNKDFTQEQIETALKPNTVLIPWGWSFKNPHEPYSIADIFGLGTSETMDKYSDLYPTLQKYENECRFAPETILGYHCMKNNVVAVEYMINFTFTYPDDLIGKEKFKIIGKPWKGKIYYYPVK